MPDAFWTFAALVLTMSGMGWLALAMDVHWKQVHTSSPSPAKAAVLRVLGWIALLASLVLCLLADTATMASLVWMMMLAVSAGAIAFVLTWRPRLLALLAPA